MTLNKTQKRHLRQLSHQGLAPTVQVSQNGLSEAFLEESKNMLDRHELLKIKYAIDDRQQRKQAFNELLEQLEAQSIQSIGKTLLIFKRNLKKPVIALPSG